MEINKVNTGFINPVLPKELDKTKVVAVPEVKNPNPLPEISKVEEDPNKKVTKGKNIDVTV